MVKVQNPDEVVQNPDQGSPESGREQVSEQGKNRERTGKVVDGGGAHQIAEEVDPLDYPFEGEKHEGIDSGGEPVEQGGRARSCW
jgi:hypothetical protein